jgi:hypothetical protein
MTSYEALRYIGPTACICSPLCTMRTQLTGLQHHIASSLTTRTSSTVDFIRQPTGSSTSPSLPALIASILLAAASESSQVLLCREEYYAKTWKRSIISYILQYHSMMRLPVQFHRLCRSSLCKAIPATGVESGSRLSTILVQLTTQLIKPCQNSCQVIS